MKKNAITGTLISLIPEEFSKEYEKVRKVLDLYARHLHAGLQELRVLDVCNSGSDLNLQLIRFINTLPPLPKQTVKRHKAYKQEALSRIGGIVKGILGIKSNVNGIPHADIKSWPVDLVPILQMLPHAKGIRRYPKIKLSDVKNIEEFKLELVSALTRDGRDLLGAILVVVKRNSVASVEEVMVKHARDVIAAIKEIYHSERWHRLHRLFADVRKKNNFPGLNKPKASLDMAMWPPTLRKQAEIFLERSAAGLESDITLRKFAKDANVNISQLATGTRSLYIKSVEYALHFIPYKRDLDVTDLLILRPVKRQVGNGRRATVLHNPLVDVFREHERGLETDRKRYGYDTDAFEHFICGIKAIAAFNGIFDLHKPFSSAYVLAKDLDCRIRVKAQKKKIFSLNWIDAEIERLLPEYYRIIKSKAYRLDNVALKPKERRRNLRFCIFFITLLTLRFLGYRQQYIRSCKAGGNIIFEKDGAITLRWEIEQTKNKKLVTLRLKAYPKIISR